MVVLACGYVVELKPEHVRAFSNVCTILPSWLLSNQPLLLRRFDPGALKHFHCIGIRKAQESEDYKIGDKGAIVSVEILFAFVSKSNWNGVKV